jgi:hypothetical protein
MAVLLCKMTGLLSHITAMFWYTDIKALLQHQTALMSHILMFMLVMLDCLTHLDNFLCYQNKHTYHSQGQSKVTLVKVKN